MRCDFRPNRTNSSKYCQPTNEDHSRLSLLANNSLILDYTRSLWSQSELSKMWFFFLICFVLLTTSARNADTYSPTSSTLKLRHLSVLHNADLLFVSVGLSVTTKLQPELTYLITWSFTPVIPDSVSLNPLLSHSWLPHWVCGNYVLHDWNAFGGEKRWYSMRALRAGKFY